MRFQFRVNKVEIAVALRAGKGNPPELIAVDSQVGKFYLTEEDELEARDIKLAAALNIQLQDGVWMRVTVAQAVTMLVEINGKTEETDKESRSEDSRRR